MTNENTSGESARRRWPPIVSIALLLGLGTYAVLRGPTNLSPLAALALLGAGSLVLAYTMSHVRQAFDNALTGAIHGIALFLAGIAWVAYLSMVVEARTGAHLLQRFETLLRSETAQDALVNLGPAMTVVLLILTFIVVALAFLFVVYTDAFGPKRNKTR